MDPETEEVNNIEEVDNKDKEVNNLENNGEQESGEEKKNEVDGTEKEEEKPEEEVENQEAEEADGGENKENADEEEVEKEEVEEVKEEEAEKEEEQAVESEKEEAEEDESNKEENESNKEEGESSKEEDESNKEEGESNKEEGVSNKEEDESNKEEAASDADQEQTKDGDQEEAEKEEDTMENVENDKEEEAEDDEHIEENEGDVSNQEETEDATSNAPEEKKTEKMNGEKNHTEDLSEIANQNGFDIPRDPAMSTTAQAQDPEKLKQVVADMRSDEQGHEGKRWILLGHVDNKPNQIDIVSCDMSAEANIEDFRSKLQDDQVMYGLLRLNTDVDMSKTVRFVYVHWVGDEVPFAKKGRFGVVQGSVQEFFNPYHSIIETGSRDDLVDEEISKLLEDTSMTSSKVLAVDVAMGRQQRGFTAHQVSQKDKGPIKSLAPDALGIEVTSELQEAIGEVRNDRNPMSWVLAGYEDSDVKKPLTLISKGEGDVEELKKYLADDQVMYGLVRTSDTYDEITTVKFVYLYWIGEGVKPMFRGKVSAHGGPIEKVFSPAHVGISFNNTYDISQEIIMDKVTASSGSKSWIKDGYAMNLNWAGSTTDLSNPTATKLKVIKAGNKPDAKKMAS